MKNLINKLTRMVKDGYKTKLVYDGEEYVVFRVKFTLPNYAATETNKTLVKDNLTCEIENGNLILSKLFMLNKFIPGSGDMTAKKLDNFKEDVEKTLFLLAIE